MDLTVVEVAGAVAVKVVEGLEDVLGDVVARLRLWRAVVGGWWCDAMSARDEVW